jgi:hypothetical protein
MNSNSNNNLDPPDPFDPKSLRIDPANDPGSGVKKLLLHVPVRKPHRQEFFRCRRDPDYRVPMAILELKEEREFYAVTPAVAADLAGEVRSVEMRICTSPCRPRMGAATPGMRPREKRLSMRKPSGSACLPTWERDATTSRPRQMDCPTLTGPSIPLVIS